MAIHLSTPPFSGGERPRLPSAQVGPVTQAIRAMRGADHCTPRVQTSTMADDAIEAIRDGLIRYFVEETGGDRQRVRDLRRRIADRIEADLALLDALDGDTDHEADFLDRRRERDGAFYTTGCTSDDEPSLCGLMVQSPGGLGDDREYDEAEGLGPLPDWSGHGVDEVFVGRRA